MIFYIAVLVVMTFLGATASLFLKKASGSEGILALMQNVNFYLGGMLYLLAAVLNIYILKFLEYSVVLPLTSLTYLDNGPVLFCPERKDYRKENAWGGADFGRRGGSIHVTG